MTEFSIKQNDTRPSLKAELRGEYNEARDFTNVTVQSITFHMESIDTTEVVVDSEATIVNAKDGIVAYEWDDGDTADAGKYIGEFQIEYQDSGTETFPNNDNIDIIIRKDIA